jgi:hypothetical protein
LARQPFPGKNSQPIDLPAAGTGLRACHGHPDLPRLCGREDKSKARLSTMELMPCSWFPISAGRAFSHKADLLDEKGQFLNIMIECMV